MPIQVPDPSVVLLIGPSGSGKTTFARAQFRPTEILTSDAFRAMVADDENAPDAGGDAFLSLRFIAAKRLRRRLLTVIDATNVRAASRKQFVDLSRHHELPVIAIVFDLPDPIRLERNRLHRNLPSEDLERQAADLRASLPLLKQEGLAAIHILDSAEAASHSVIERLPSAAPSAPSTAPPPDHEQLDLLSR
jgi:protein phosphatase